jgi:phosphotransferase system HPr (HPr) family protein
MLEETVRVINPLGLHARAAGQLVKIAGRFRSRIMVKRQDGSAEADAKSMLGVLTLAASVNTTLVLCTEGTDEADAMAAVKHIFETGFGEILN